MTTERHGHREDNRREVLRWLHLLIAEGHRAYPAEPRPELGLAWGPDGRRIDIQPWAGPDEVLDSDVEYDSGAEYSSEAEYASGGEHGQIGGVEGEAAEEGFEVLEGKHFSGGASDGEAANERDASAGVHAEDGADGDVVPGEEVAEPRAGAGLAPDAAERTEAPESTGTGGTPSREGAGASGSKEGELGAVAAADSVGSAADGEAGPLLEADQEARAEPGDEAHPDSAEDLHLGKPENNV